MSLLGIDILPRERLAWTFHLIKYKITNDNTKEVFKEDEYWTCYTQFVDRDLIEYVDAFGKENTYYTWNWESIKQQVGPPHDMLYMTMNGY